MPHVGIGITTRNRYRVLQLALSRFNIFTPEGAQIVIVDDNSKDSTAALCENTLTAHPFTHVYMPRQAGVSLAKNECLRRLKDCEHIFLFDDDCFPKKDGWAEFYISTATDTGLHHLIYSKPNALGSARLVKKDDRVFSLSVPTGCLMYVDAEVLRCVGGFNADYSYYGHEHIGYSTRIHKAGLTPYGAFCAPLKAEKYIHSIDLDGVGAYADIIGGAFGSAEPIELRRLWVSLGSKVFKEEITTGSLYHEL